MFIGIIVFETRWASQCHILGGKLLYPLLDKDLLFLNKYAKLARFRCPHIVAGVA